MDLNDVRVGFIGCGVHATVVLLPAVRRAGLDLAAVCDLDKRLAQRMTRRFGAYRSYQDLRRMIEEMDVDAVLVCGPPEMHAEAASIAIELGRHVWVEAPPAPTAAEARRIADLAAERGVLAQVGLMMRFAPAYRRLAEVVGAQDFGQPVSLEAVWWPPERSGHEEPLIHDLPHMLDLLRHLGGDVTQLGTVRQDDRQASASVVLRFASGALGSLSFSAPSACPRERLTVASRDAVATVEDRLALTLRRRDTDETMTWRPGACPGGVESTMGHLRGYLPEIGQFARSVLGEAEPAATMADAVEAMRLAELVVASDGEMVTVG